ncbi:hypothetical protein [Bradyrhizobium brasilense]|nr:hypothetical protein [Bradyrhizobium brasilense]
MAQIVERRERAQERREERIEEIAEIAKGNAELGTAVRYPLSSLD